VRIPKDLSVIHIVTIPPDLVPFVEMAESKWPILVNFLRFTTGQQRAEFIDNSNELRQMGREVSRGLFETLVTVCKTYYQRVIEDVKE
jgi:hypothetical protein